jgi:uncharacterized membrane protein YeaQ/YmgE (transglycosylase-associated protein family)
VHVFISIAIGALIGLLAALATKAAHWLGYAADVALGIAGALPAAWFLAPLAAGPGLNRAEIGGAFFGAVFLLALVKLFAPSVKR